MYIFYSSTTFSCIIRDNSATLLCCICDYSAALLYLFRCWAVLEIVPQTSTCTNTLLHNFTMLKYVTRINVFVADTIVVFLWYSAQV